MNRTPIHLIAVILLASFAGSHHANAATRLVCITTSGSVVADERSPAPYTEGLGTFEINLSDGRTVQCTHLPAEDQ